MSTKQVVIEVPETVLLAEKTDEKAFARELSILAAVKLYELGRLSSGRAAELAGMSRGDCDGCLPCLPHSSFPRTQKAQSPPARLLSL